MLVEKIPAKIGLSFGLGEIGGEWAPGTVEHAAWEMYIELVTRVGVVELGAERGLVRETLSSWYCSRRRGRFFEGTARRLLGQLRTRRPLLVS